MQNKRSESFRNANIGRNVMRNEFLATRWALLKVFLKLIDSSILLYVKWTARYEYQNTIIDIGVLNYEEGIYRQSTKKVCPWTLKKKQTSSFEY